ncbi:hypothetical protein [Oceanobacter antarcticus]|uniref:Uncharacterized protein n=1 Tax=Oceanobacter antarcticus TaxID=3133425 RepID=A0ABW8NH88_9GAMM
MRCKRLLSRDPAMSASLSDEFFTLKPTVGGQELTMARYSIERREAVLKKLLPPHNRSVPEVSRVHVIVRVHIAYRPRSPFLLKCANSELN